MSYSDKDAYSFKSEPVDLGQQLGQPRIEGPKPDGASDLPDASSQSPLSQMRGGADPSMNAEEGTYWPEPTASDAVNVEMPYRPYKPMYEPK